ncbi:hypothetical protein [uncultured Polaribacter sp.]|uniref:hypothetical protein n=1 Tax=uncultured Polaribacter sp. TaxID=174711 RepID=UPI0026386C8C|nr:hypothetical protein [uncultured Polaribacter sp.]
MTKRDFFILTIKIFGLYSIITALFSTLPNNISFVIQNIEFTGIIWLIITTLIIIGLFYLLLRKADKVSDILKLEKGFDQERIDFGGLKSLDIIKFGILIIGGFLFIENIPTFLSHTLFAFKSSIPQGFDQAYENRGILKYNRLEDYVYWISSGMNLLVGYLLIVNFKKISNYLNKKTTE